MIIGRGLIASEFKKQAQRGDWEDVLIYASGVSNSTNPSPDALRKEVREIDEILAQKVELVYFSTLSVLGAKTAQSLYCRHKLQVEEKVLGQGGKIVRLPLVVGEIGRNPTLLNHFARLLDQDSDIMVQRSAVRNLVDVEHLPGLVLCWLKDKEQPKTLSVSTPLDITALEIAQTLRSIRGSESRLVLTDGGDHYPNFYNSSSAFFRELGVYFDNSYNRNLMEKYFATKSP